MKATQSTSKSGVFWNYVQEEEGKATVLLYGDIGNSEKIDPEDIVSQLIGLSGKFSKIDIHINSNGGDVFSGISIYNALCQSKADITIYIDGIAASIAGIVALCGKPLYMSQYARLMIHSISSGMYGNKVELQNMISTIENLEDIIAEMISERIMKSKEELKSIYFDGKDHWITAREALDMGLIDGIYDVKDTIPQSKNCSHENIYNYFNNRLIESKTKKQNMELLNQIRNIPSFADMQTEEQIINRIIVLESMQPYQSIRDARTLVNKAVGEGYIESSEASGLLSLSNGDLNRLRTHIENRMQKKKAAFNDEYFNLTKEKSEYDVLRNLPDSFINNELKQFASKDFATFKRIVEATRKKRVMDSILSPSPVNGDKSGWTLEDYRKKAPMELKNNPRLYKSLLEQKFNNKY